MRVLVLRKTHPTEEAGYLAQTMYHEPAHKVGGLADLKCDVNTWLQYALSVPANAANNAENYNRIL